MAVRAMARKCSGLIVLMQRAYALMQHRLRLLMQRVLMQNNERCGIQMLNAVCPLGHKC